MSNQIIINSFDNSGIICPNCKSNNIDSMPRSVDSYQTINSKSFVFNFEFMCQDCDAIFKFKLLASDYIIKYQLGDETIYPFELK
jgi:hypothetical protein